MAKTYYEEFGISENASIDEIKQAYRKLVIKFHPDKHYGDLKFEIIFKRINHIYQVLSDPTAKNKYDDELKEIRKAATRAGEYHGTYQRTARQAQNPSATQVSGYNTSTWVGIWLLILLLRFAASTDNLNSTNKKSFINSSYYAPSEFNFRIDTTSVGEKLFGSLSSVKSTSKDSAGITGDAGQRRK